MDELEGTRSEPVPAPEAEPFTLGVGVELFRIVDACERTEDIDAAEDFGLGAGAGAGDGDGRGDGVGVCVGVCSDASSTIRDRATDDRGVFVLDELLVTSSRSGLGPASGGCSSSSTDADTDLLEAKDAALDGLLDGVNFESGLNDAEAEAALVVRLDAVLVLVVLTREEVE